ncbi:phospholipase D-like domain-containing protein [Deinococcus yavapaiensis]|uniref:phospholipase D n=1 Tax=Deinococcus yavapaiensis KR-236 TaxID=694435 RepID=A0A318S8E9_9DEIO|nr:phospholipase D-like domain-containing protein [Deinococcus yavapaiensis]PYE52061.1 phosphatidylserine/phosphatidylglycerophosphate/cardiolipin synthase-like enzyme [Deinococcus yavapaiensis KR-236]
MRRTRSQDGVTLKAYAGTTGVLLAFDLAETRRPGLLGFAVHRSAPDGSDRWLSGQLAFPGQAHEPSEALSTNTAPIQAFRWGDYAVYPNRTYTYTLHPVYGVPGALDVRPGPSVTVTTHPQDAGEHIVTFNRAAAASQAFARRFPGMADDLRARKKNGQVAVLPAEALAWLSRGALEQIERFIDAALDDTWSLDIAIYEYELQPIVHAVERALRRRVNVRIVYHAKNGDDATTENEEHLTRVPDGAKRGRVTSSIHHHKFMVRGRIIDGVRTPHAVLCGSTNFTENGVYRQANVVHVAQSPQIAWSYQGVFDVLFSGADPKATRAYIDAHNKLPDAWGECFAGFSPRRGGADLDAFARLIGEARRDVLFCTAFDLDRRIVAALWGQKNDDVLRLGVQNRAQDVQDIIGTNRDRGRQFVATALLPEGLERFFKEDTAGQAGNILIHTKLIVLDFTSDQPTVISGSHNFSKNASANNDENYLVLRGNTDVADMYGCELLRVYDHYRFRYLISQAAKAGPVAPRTLKADDSWTNEYFGEDAQRTLDRRRFAGKEGV